MIEDITIDRKSGEAVSNQIAKYLRSRIVDKKLKPGDKLPTTLEIVESIGVGSHTFRTAISKLEEEGLVESSPRRGTFVKNIFRAKESRNLSEEANSYAANNRNVRLRRLAIMSAVTPPSLVGEKTDSKSGLYRPETVAGILKECETHGVVAQIFPSELLDAPAEEVYGTFKDFGCDGAIWPGPSEAHWNTIKYLLGQSFPVVATSRNRMSVGCACIESDYDNAGFSAGNHLVENGCDSVLLFTHFAEPLYVREKPLSSYYPYGIRQGIARAFEMHGLDPSGSITSQECPGTFAIDERLMAALEKSGQKTAPIFTNAHQFLTLLKTEGEKTRDVLYGKEFIILSNYTISVELAPLMGGLDPMVLVDPFEDVGRFAIQKALGMIEGYLADTTTLVNIGFVRFSELGLLVKEQ